MGVYVHIPFCAKKCYYCDFYSIVVRNEMKFRQVANNYLYSLRKEALFYSPKLKGIRLNTLYLGGGTPTLLSATSLAKLIDFLLQSLPFSAQTEITVEANPSSLSLEDLRVLAKSGVNRISLGVQAFQDRHLQALGRTHKVGDVVRTVGLARAAGIENLNLDLIFGLPTQSLQDWMETLQRAVAMNPSHISCYALILEEGTPFFSWYNLGLLELPSDDLQVQMYTLARRILRNVGYQHYEISNFCLPGYRSAHNLLYWHNLPFLGLGAGATGYLNRIRYTNLPDLEKYIKSWLQSEPIFSGKEKISKDQEMDDTMMVGMRLLEGVDAAEFKNRYGLNLWELYPEEIERLNQRGLVEYKDGFLKVTGRGLYLENIVSSAFLRNV